jgi:hypothetical protein
MDAVLGRDHAAASDSASIVQHDYGVTAFGDERDVQPNIAIQRDAVTNPDERRNGPAQIARNFSSKVLANRMERVGPYHPLGVEPIHDARNNGKRIVEGCAACRGHNGSLV